MIAVLTAGTPETVTNAIKKWRVCRPGADAFTPR
jgi:hypothetical protein